MGEEALYRRLTRPEDLSRQSRAGEKNQIGLPSSSRIRFRIQRACKALDDGRFRKWIFVVKASDLPLRLPLDANARMPNILKNATCAEMRETLLFHPELFQILNGGTICTGSAAEVSEEGGEKFAEI